MIIEILTIGDEIVDGRRVDTNASWMARRLSFWGHPPRYRQSVTDRMDDMVEAFRLALSRSDLILSTGGLGPTVDDMTFEAIAKVLEQDLVFREEILQRIQTKFQNRGISMSENNRRQANLPKEAEELLNEKGTAPAILCRRDGKSIMAFPGVPSEMKPIFEKHVASEIEGREGQTKEGRFSEETYRFVGLPESELETRVEKLGLREVQDAEVRVAYTASFPYISVTLSVRAPDDGKKAKALQALDSKLRESLGEYLAVKGSGTLEEALVKELRGRKQKVALAESITGGLVASHLINVPGSSEVLDLAIVAYGNRQKEELLGVSSDLLREKGAVSEECARAMAEGIRDRAQADIGISTTGIAGPTGSSADKPLGLTYIAWAAKDRTLVRRYEFRWDRNRNRMRATFEALMGLKAILK